MSAWKTDGEGYTDTGVIFTMEDNIVSAIRVYGLSARTTEAEISTVRDNLRFDALFDDYVQVPSSYNGARICPCLTERTCSSPALTS